MGGYGSGRPRVHTLVEDCHLLDVGHWVRGGVIAPAVRRTGTWVWRNRWNEITSSIKYLVDTLDYKCAFVELEYTVWYAREPCRYRVSLTTTTPHFGGRRWWFR